MSASLRTSMLAPRTSYLSPRNPHLKPCTSNLAPRSSTSSQIAVRIPNLTHCMFLSCLTTSMPYFAPHLLQYHIPCPSQLTPRASHITSYMVSRISKSQLTPATPGISYLKAQLHVECTSQFTSHSLHLAPQASYSQRVPLTSCQYFANRTLHFAHCTSELIPRACNSVPINSHLVPVISHLTIHASFTTPYTS